MPSTMLLPFKENLLAKFGIPLEMSCMPRLHYIIILCASLFNEFHPGFCKLYLLGDEQEEYAERIVTATFEA